MSETSSVRVEIFDQGYNLRGTDPEYITRLAEYVDLKMRTIAQQTTTVDSLRLAILAAINIADEVHILKGRGERPPDQKPADYKGRVQSLAGALDEVLQETRRAG